MALMRQRLVPPSPPTNATVVASHHDTLVIRLTTAGTVAENGSDRDQAYFTRVLVDGLADPSRDLLLKPGELSLTITAVEPDCEYRVAFQRCRAEQYQPATMQNTSDHGCWSTASEPVVLVRTPKDPTTLRLESERTELEARVVSALQEAWATQEVEAMMQALRRFRAMPPWDGGEAGSRWMSKTQELACRELGQKIARRLRPPAVGNVRKVNETSTSHSLGVAWDGPLPTTERAGQQIYYDFELYESTPRLLGLGASDNTRVFQLITPLEVVVGPKTPLQPAAAVAVSVHVPGLKPSTRYFARIRAVRAEQRQQQPQASSLQWHDGPFITTACVPGAPIMEAPSAKDVGRHEIRVGWTPPAADAHEFAEQTYAYRLHVSESRILEGIQDLISNRPQVVVDVPSGSHEFVLGGEADAGGIDITPNTTYYVAISARRVITDVTPQYLTGDWGEQSSEELVVTTLTGPQKLPPPMNLSVTVVGKSFRVSWEPDPRTSDPRGTGKLLRPRDKVEYSLRYWMDPDSVLLGDFTSRAFHLPGRLPDGGAPVFGSDSLDVPTDASALEVVSCPPRNHAMYHKDFKYGHAVKFALKQRVAKYSAEHLEATPWSAELVVRAVIPGLLGPVPRVSRHPWFHTWMVVEWDRRPADETAAECQYKLTWRECDPAEQGSDSAGDSLLETAGGFYNNHKAILAPMGGAVVGFLAGGFGGAVSGASTASKVEGARHVYDNLVGLRDLVLFGKDRERHNVRVGSRRRVVIKNVSTRMMYEVSVALKPPGEPETNGDGPPAMLDPAPSGPRLARRWAEAVATNVLTFMVSLFVVATAVWLCVRRTAQVKSMSIVTQLVPGTVVVVLCSLVLLSPSYLARRLRHPLLKAYVYNSLLGIAVVAVLVAWAVGPMLSFATGMSNLKRIVGEPNGPFLAAPGEDGASGGAAGIGTGVSSSEAMALANHVGVDLDAAESERLLISVWTEACEAAAGRGAPECDASKAPAELSLDHLQALEQRLLALQREQSLVVQLADQLTMFKNSMLSSFDD